MLVSMSSDLFLFDGPSFFTDPFSPFSDSSIDILQAFTDNNGNSLTSENPADDNDQFAPPLFSSSPPSHQLQNLSLYQTTAHFGNSANGFSEFSGLEVKTEECQIPFYSSSHEYNNNKNTSFLPQSYGGSDNAVKLMQRSYSSNCFDGKPTNFLFQPTFDSLMESPNLHTQLLNSPESCLSSGQMRRACSTGDLQTTKTSHRLSSSPLATESSFMEEANCKVGKYSAEERKERILRYRAKRTQRNFNKTIKYACRKTLADNRPRIRGRFARNDEPGEIPNKAATFHRYEDEDERWIDGFHEEDDEGIVGRGQFFSSSYGPTQFQHYGYS